MKLSTFFTKMARIVDSQPAAITNGMCIAARCVKGAHQGMMRTADIILDSHEGDGQRCGFYHSFWGANFGVFGAARECNVRLAKQGRVLFLLMIAAQLKAEGR